MHVAALESSAYVPAGHPGGPHVPVRSKQSALVVSKVDPTGHELAATGQSCAMAIASLDNALGTQQQPSVPAWVAVQL